MKKMVIQRAVRGEMYKMLGWRQEDQTSRRIPGWQSVYIDKSAGGGKPVAGPPTPEADHECEAAVPDARHSSDRVTQPIPVLASRAMVCICSLA